jgi:hypothetical protein
MRKLLLLVVVGLVILFSNPTQAKAIELLMFSNPNCGYCQNFLKEVQPTYHESPAGEQMPLHIINMDKPVPDWYVQAFKEKRIGRIAATPTFIIWTDREEYRWAGYDGADKFWSILGEFMKTNGHLFGGEAFLGKENNKQWKPDVDLPKLHSDPRMDPNSSHNKPFKRPTVPEGVVDSDNIFDHTYDTPHKALAAADYLECGSNVHYHAKENVWMPCSMSISPGTNDLMKEGS